MSLESTAFAGRTVLVTGASSGMGESMVRRLAPLGCKLGLIARRTERLRTLADSLSASGSVIALAGADVSDRDSLRAAVSNLRDTLGAFDLVIVNAGVGTPTLLDPLNLADVESMIRVNLMGMIYTIEATLPEMLARRSGRIAAVTSLGADRGMPGEMAYCASKAAMNVWLEGLRVQVRGTGVSISTLVPGFVTTPMTEVNSFHMPFLLTADRAAARMLRAIARGRKVYRFPLRMSLLSRLLQILPDRAVGWIMKDYNAHPPMNDLGGSGRSA